MNRKNRWPNGFGQRFLGVVEGSRFKVQGAGLSGGDAAHFVILSGEKRRVLRKR